MIHFIPKNSEGFHRKAGFCQRLAATRQVSPNNPSPDWQKCYYLMLHSFPGYKLSLDPNYVIQHQVGKLFYDHKRYSELRPFWHYKLSFIVLGIFLLQYVNKRIFVSFFLYYDITNKNILRLASSSNSVVARVGGCLSSHGASGSGHQTHDVLTADHVAASVQAGAQRTGHTAAGNVNDLFLCKVTIINPWHA